MSDRSSDVLKREHRLAHRPKPRSSRHNAPRTDVIDSLDTIGGAYHHSGPYDAASAAQNRHKKYSPLDAVYDSNMEAIKATPREYIRDCLDKHMPLQGTSTIPPGFPDMRGHVMDYREGTDLMREPDAGGGPYKRWPDIVSSAVLDVMGTNRRELTPCPSLKRYHPDDLKGKGEPSYTIEKDLKEKKCQKHQRNYALGGGLGAADDFELQPGIIRHPYLRGHATTRQRSVSDTLGASPPRPDKLLPPDDVSNDCDISRRNTTGKHFGEGIRRRLGHLRSKKETEY